MRLIDMLYLYINKFYTLARMVVSSFNETIIGYIYIRYHSSYLEVPILKMGIIERLLHYEFRELNIRYNAGEGEEFYNKEIITRIEPYL